MIITALGPLIRILVTYEKYYFWAEIEKKNHENSPKSPPEAVFRPNYRWCVANFQYFAYVTTENLELP